jgi:hypothetical protein
MTGYSPERIAALRALGVCVEMVDEIERLAAERDDARKQVADWSEIAVGYQRERDAAIAEWDGLVSENDTLRKMMDQIIDECSGWAVAIAPPPMTEITDAMVKAAANAICCVECHENGLAFEQILFFKDIDAIARAALDAARGLGGVKEGPSE